ncbi:MAG: hypothetical protein Ta2B_00530 [Termitinemataceae bacterium]|nr:MAG: hypothetical protein Ta2B_00530 [Termitinemataceae bacterium]
MIHSNLENTTGARGSPHIFFVIYYPIKLKDPTGRAGDKRLGPDLNLFPKDEPIRAYAEFIVNSEHTYIVAMHGSPTSVSTTGSSDGTLSATDLAKMIHDDPNYKAGLIVILLSCETGKSISGDNFAQQLADAMGPDEQVIAPTDFAWFSSNGNVSIAPPDKNNPDFPDSVRLEPMKTFTGRPDVSHPQDWQDDFL